MVCCYLRSFSWLGISTDCSSCLSLSQCFSNKINKPLGISRFWYYERLHFLTESNKSIFLRGLKFSIYVKKYMNLQHYLLLDPAHLAWPSLEKNDETSTSTLAMKKLQQFFYWNGKRKKRKWIFLLWFFIFSNAILY